MTSDVTLIVQAKNSTAAPITVTPEPIEDRVLTEYHFELTEYPEWID